MDKYSTKKYISESFVILLMFVFCCQMNATPTAAQEKCLNDCELDWAACTLTAAAAYDLALLGCAFTGPAAVECAGAATLVCAAAIAGCTVYEKICKIKCLKVKE